MMYKITLVLAIVLIICSFPLFSADSQTVTFRAPVSGGGAGVEVLLYRFYEPSTWYEYGTLIYQGPNPNHTANYYELQRDAYPATYKVTAEWSQAGDVYYDEVIQEFTVYQWFWTFPYLYVLPPPEPDPVIPNDD